ncbi:putative bifunctional diguanylate cyclase/phosphodiesterase [Sphingomicrobium nitratireducens]|uniref:putative bifunctional diguanylate cyclase/phosphodiesterase n=1 Tax=Sphingomicrobium nitratireducens TaxID=2964666 RepID=UPI0022405EA1|nr:EAL domain-containing protein [Sphingomicrobium nitratireducens]
MKKNGTAQKISNAILSGLAGVASFLFSLIAFLYITDFNEQILASLVAGAFCLLICYIASERPNSESARALSALGDRLLAVEDGDFATPAPAIVQRAMPDVAKAVDHLFAEVRASIENAHALGMYDPVTSLPNRLHFRAEADKALGETANDRLAAMLFVDLDRFKGVNDSLGHARGDQLLTMVANRLRVVVTAEMEQVGGQRPLLARLAGDEFTIFFPRLTSADHAGRVARRIALAIAEPFELHGHSIDIGASIGVALVPEHGTTIEQLMRAADIAMYRAKALGGGQHIVFSDDLLREHEEKIATEHALTEALQRGEFAMAMQPQVDLATGKMTGAEALLRWNHPREGRRHPDSFIGIAEKSGLIADIGDWVMAECASLLADWANRGEARRLAFNISPRQLDRADFFNRMRTILDERGVPLSLVELEFTETTAMQCSPEQIEAIAQLREDGATVAIDDFGTGYSNIARLRAMPLDRVKLDPSLIADIDTNEQAREIVQAVVTLIHAVGAEIVAEAVETESQAEILRAMGCRTVQGYLFAQPMERDEFFAWVDASDEAARNVA